MGIAFLGAFGAAIGSFVNVLAYRLPRRESIVKPRSRCPHCDTQIAGYDNVPVVSWIVLRGHCRHCGVAIPARYPLVEALTALLFVGVGLKIGLEDTLIPALALTITLVAAAETDLEHRIIPNRLVAVSAIAAVALWAIVDPGRLPENLIAGAAAGGFLLAAAVAYPAGMGMGDVKLAGVMGLYLGTSVAPALFIGFATGAVVGIGIVLIRGMSARKQGVPFGPFLGFGGIVALLYGPAIIDWYGRLSGLGG
jgi:leader peptidase (prepilin peptidase) / N-methyltransferase